MRHPFKTAFIWNAGLVLVFMTAWGIHSNPFMVVDVPNELLFLDEDASESLVALSKSRIQTAFWTNLLVHFGLTGVAFGWLGLLLKPNRQSRIQFLFFTLGCGIICSLTAGVVGTALRYYADFYLYSTHTVASIFSDMIVLGVASAFFAGPVALVKWVTVDRYPVVVGLLSASIGGSLAPLLTAVATTAGLVSQHAATENFPVLGSEIVAIWMASMLVGIVTLGSHLRPKLSATEPSMATA